MKVLLVGSGGREHALATKLSRSASVTQLLIWPGNPAIKGCGQLLDLAASASWPELVQRAKAVNVDFVVVGPEKPLAEGLVDLCQEFGIAVFGPSAAAAQLEASKAFAKDVMAKANIPTAAFKVVEGEKACREAALHTLKASGGAVIKASGLASGKGVFVCRTSDDVDEAIGRLYGGSMSAAAETVVIEEILEGRECSYFCLVGEKGVSSLGFAVDFKRLKENDQGPNTGGMGCYSPVPWLPENAADKVQELVVQPLLKELARRGAPYQGYLYVGIMWGDQGPKVVEFNVRLGDPEAQVLVTQDQRDWALMIAEQLGIKGSEKAASAAAPSKARVAVAVVMASSSYPYGGEEGPAKVFGEPSPFSNEDPDCAVFGASVIEREGKCVSGQGRVLTVVAAAADFETARARVYEKADQLAKDWPGVQYRRDIAGRVVSEGTLS